MPAASHNLKLPRQRHSSPGPPAHTTDASAYRSHTTPVGTYYYRSTHSTCKLRQASHPRPRRYEAVFSLDDLSAIRTGGARDSDATKQRRSERLRRTCTVHTRTSRPAGHTFGKMRSKWVLAWRGTEAGQHACSRRFVSFARTPNRIRFAIPNVRTGTVHAPAGSARSAVH
jgi:hypothetical protein